MSGEHHQSGEGDWRDAPDNGSRALDELSREETLQALAGLDERLRADADDAYSLIARGMLHSKLGDDRRVSKGFGSVIELEPDNAVALYSRGACLARLGDLGRGRGGLRPGNRAGSGRRVPILQPGLRLRGDGRPAPGLEDFDQAIDLDPGNHTFHHYWGIAHRELGEFDWAVSDFDAALRLEPLSNPSRTARGVARVMQGDYDTVTADFDAVLELDLDNPDP